MTEYELPDPYAYIYEFDSVFGLHQSFSSREYNGSKPSCTVLVYTADQLREEITKAEQRGRESSDGLVEAVETLLSVIDSGVVDISPDLVSVIRVRRHLKELK